MIMEGSGKEKSLKEGNKAHRLCFHACGRAYAGVCSWVLARACLRVCACTLHEGVGVCAYLRNRACVRAGGYVCMCLCECARLHELACMCEHLSVCACLGMLARLHVCCLRMRNCAYVSARTYANVRSSGYVCERVCVACTNVRARLHERMGMRACVRTYTSKHACACMHARGHVPVRVWAPTRACVCASAPAHGCCLHVYPCVHMRAHACLRACMCVFPARACLAICECVCVHWKGFPLHNCTLSVLIWRYWFQIAI